MGTTVTEVEFHTGVADPLAFACRLLRKAYRSGVRVQVTAPAATLAALDRQLWTFEERDFVPHVRLPGASTAVAARTPIWLVAQAGLADAPPLLVNLGADAPPDPGALDRLIEIVSAEPDDAARGRERWRAYKGRGLAIRHHAAATSHE
jgi:DNA polymerase-3 subunit chi